MTFRQGVLKLIYPAWNLYARLSGRHMLKAKNEGRVLPQTPLFDLFVTTPDGKIHQLTEFKGKKLLLVNTASNCVYTRQYEGLQKLHDRYGDHLVIIGFPSNEFKKQEKGNDREIEEFCSANYGVRFPLSEKTQVRKKSDRQHPVFQWLTHKKKNGWNEQEPVWNFTKYLVDEEGVLLAVFGPPVSPLSQDIIKLLIRRR